LSSFVWRSRRFGHLRRALPRWNLEGSRCERIIAVCCEGLQELESTTAFGPLAPISVGRFNGSSGIWLGVNLGRREREPWSRIFPPESHCGRGSCFLSNRSRAISASCSCRSSIGHTAALPRRFVRRDRIYRHVGACSARGPRPSNSRTLPRFQRHVDHWLSFRNAERTIRPRSFGCGMPKRDGSAVERGTRSKRFAERRNTRAPSRNRSHVLSPKDHFVVWARRPCGSSATVEASPTCRARLPSLRGCVRPSIRAACKRIATERIPTNLRDADARVIPAEVVRRTETSEFQFEGRELISVVTRPASTVGARPQSGHRPVLRMQLR